MPWGCLRFVIVVFRDHTHLLLLIQYLGFLNIKLFIFIHNSLLVLNINAGLQTSDGKGYFSIVFLNSALKIKLKGVILFAV